MRPNIKIMNFIFLNLSKKNKKQKALLVHNFFFQKSQNSSMIKDTNE